MPLLRLYYHLVRADLLERTRRYSFLVSLLVVIYLGYAVNIGQISFVTTGARSVMNSAWIGLQMALIIGNFATLIGFYLVKNCIDRDERTGVGQILATTPLTSWQYLLGKWLSNLIVLVSILLILSVAAILMQVLQTEHTVFDAWALLSPIWFIGLPLMSVTAALAVVFESRPELRGGAGNLVFFAVWLMGLMGSIQLLLITFPEYEPFGLGLAMHSIQAAVAQVSPGFTGHGGGFYLWYAPVDPTATVFVYTGIAWTPASLIGRLMIFLAPLLLIRLAAAYFGRFDPARISLRLMVKQSGVEFVPDEAERAPAPRAAASSHSPFELARAEYHSAFGRLVWQYLRLILKSFPDWYYLVIAALWVGCLFSEVPTANRWLTTLSVFATLFWSRCGCREASHNMIDLAFSAPHPLRRLLLAEWVAALVVTTLLFGGVGLNLAFHADFRGVLTLAIGIVLIPSAALALGTWSRTSKLFEATYLIVWFLGIANSAPGLDFLGTTPAAFVRQMPFLAIAVAAAFLALAFIGRKRVTV